MCDRCGTERLTEDIFHPGVVRRIGERQLMSLEGKDRFIGAKLGAHLLKVCGAAEAPIFQIRDRIRMPRENPTAHELTEVNRIGAAQTMIVRIGIGIAGQGRIAILGKSIRVGSHAPPIILQRVASGKHGARPTVLRTAGDDYLAAASLLPSLSDARLAASPSLAESPRRCRCAHGRARSRDGMR